MWSENQSKGLRCGGKVSVTFTEIKQYHFMGNFAPGSSWRWHPDAAAIKCFSPGAIGSHIASQSGRWPIPEFIQKIRPFYFTPVLKGSHFSRAFRKWRSAAPGVRAGLVTAGALCFAGSTLAVGPGRAIDAAKPAVRPIETQCSGVVCGPDLVQVAEAFPTADERFNFAGDRPADDLDFPDFAGAAYWKALAFAAANEPAAVSVFDPLGAVVIKGLPSGTHLSVGKRLNATDWIISQSDLKDLVVTVPPGSPVAFAADVDVLTRTGERGGGMRIAVRQEDIRAESATPATPPSIPKVVGAEVVGTEPPALAAPPAAPSEAAPNVAVVEPPGAAPLGNVPASGLGAPLPAPETVAPVAAVPENVPAVEPQPPVPVPSPARRHAIAEEQTETPKKVVRARSGRSIAKAKLIASQGATKPMTKTATKSASLAPAQAPAPAPLQVPFLSDLLAPSQPAPENPPAPAKSAAGKQATTDATVIENAGSEILVGLGVMPRAMDEPLVIRQQKKP